MTIPAALVLRPEPANAATRGRLVSAGIGSIALPLFATHARAWTPPDPAGFDAVLLTSANAARHGGEGLATLTHLPALAVGTATAAAARVAGFTVAITGGRDLVALLAAATAAGYRRPLHLAGRHHHASGGATRIVYATDPVALAPGAIAEALSRSGVALLHSPRAARRFAALVDAASLDRMAVAIAALSPAVADAAGPGWGWIGRAAIPSDDALVTLVRDRLTLPDDGRISRA